MIKRSFHIEFGRLADHSLDYLQGILKDTRTTTILTISKLTEPEIDWQYKEGWNTIGALLSHIAGIEHYFRIEFIEGRKFTKEENDRWMPGIEMGTYLPQLIMQKPADYYIDQLTQSRQMMLEAIGSLSHADLTKRIEDYDAETGCNLAWVLYHMAEDEIYHCGQISMVRKLYKDGQK